MSSTATERRQLLDRAILLSGLSIGISAVVGGAAVGIGLATQSLSLLGFGADAVIDSAASVILIWRFRDEAVQPHRAERIEQLAERLVGAVLLVLAAYLAISAILALANGAHPDASLFRTALLIVGVTVLPPLAYAKSRVAQALNSRALRADSVLTAVAGVLAAIGLGALLLENWLSIPWGDAVGGLIISAIVVREGLSAVRTLDAK